MRIGLAGAAVLGLELPRTDKCLLVIVETDGCFADGVEVTTGCTMGHRTLRLADYGKIAATFTDVKNGVSVRVAPRLDVRGRAHDAPDEPRHYFAQLQAYMVMPDAELLTTQWVNLTPSAEVIVSRPVTEPTAPTVVKRLSTNAKLCAMVQLLVTLVRTVVITKTAQAKVTFDGTIPSPITSLH